MRLESSELRALKAVVEENGFNRAAEKLHISQSAVSQSMANLENKLGATLIKRGKQPVLTEAGKRLFDYACDQIREEELTLEDIEKIKTGEAATLSLAVNSTISRFYAAQLISQFCKNNLRVRIKVEELPSRSIIYAVLSGRTELGFGPFQKHMPAYDTVSLYQETRYLVVSPSHPDFVAICQGEPKALKKTPLIDSYLDDPDLRPSMERIRDSFSSVWEVSNLSLRISLIDQGLGVSYVNEKLLQESSRCAQFAILETLPFGSIGRQVGIYYKKGKTLSESAQNFIQLCKQRWHN